MCFFFVLWHIYFNHLLFIWGQQPRGLNLKIMVWLLQGCRKCCIAEAETATASKSPINTATCTGRSIYFASTFRFSLSDNKEVTRKLSGQTFHLLFWNPKSCPTVLMFLVGPACHRSSFGHKSSGQSKLRRARATRERRWAGVDVPRVLRSPVPVTNVPRSHIC